MNRRTLADNIDGLDDQIAELQREKSEFYAAYRAQLETAGEHKDKIKLELAAVKVAIRHRQRLARDHDAAIEKMDLADAILDEITGPAENNAPASAAAPVKGNPERPTRARAKERDRGVIMQPSRLATLADVKEAYRSGSPISGDERFEGAHIYFIHFPDLARLKIGISNNVEQRRLDLMAGSGAPGVLLGAFPGNRQAELAAHEAFAAHRLMGEWFSYSDECAAEVSDYLATRTRATHEAPPPPERPSPIIARPAVSTGLEMDAEYERRAKSTAPFEYPEMPDVLRVARATA